MLLARCPSDLMVALKLSSVLSNSISVPGCGGVVSTLVMTLWTSLSSLDLAMAFFYRGIEWGGEKGPAGFVYGLF